jgi:hypothetical protein
MYLHIVDPASGALLIAAAIFAQAWVGHCKAPPLVLSIIGWTVVVFVMLLLLGTILRW